MESEHDTATLLAQAQAAHRSGQLAAAERAYVQLSELPSATPTQRADAHYGLGTVRFQRGQLGGALAALDAALAIDSQVAEYHFNRALVLERLVRRGEAIEAFVHAARVAGGDAAVVRPAAERLLRLKAFREASALLASAPQDSTLDGLRAQALAGAGDWVGGCALARRMTDAQPQDPDRWRWRSQAAAALRDYDDAVSAHERYLALLAPARGEDHLAHADLLLSARRPHDARQALEAAKQRGAAGIECDLLEARISRLEDSLPAAVESLRRVLASRPDDGRAWQLLAELAPAGEVAAAVADLSTILDGEPSLRPGHEVLLRFACARLHERRGALALAWQTLVAANDAQHAQLRARGAAYDALEEVRINEHRLERYGALGASAISQAPASGPTVAFILGMPRSGTTLMERIIGGLKGVHTGGENEAMAFIAAGYEHALARGVLPAPQAMSAAHWAALAADYDVRSVPRDRSQTPVALTDKMPHNLQQVGLIAAIFGSRARVIWMRRHPVDVCLSIYSRRFPDGHRYACRLEDLAHFYAQSERLMRGWQEAYPALVHEVRYETLAADPAPHAQAAIEHVGLPWDPACLNISARREAAFTFSELQVREAISARHVHRHRAWGALVEPLRVALREAGVECED
ncbi:MAG: sulfotransferase [Pseudomonadota bacterium]